jgi:hypothetical protein
VEASNTNEAANCRLAVMRLLLFDNLTVLTPARNRSSPAQFLINGANAPAPAAWQASIDSSSIRSVQSHRLQRTMKKSCFKDFAFLWLSIDSSLLSAVLLFPPCASREQHIGKRGADEAAPNEEPWSRLTDHEGSPLLTLLKDESSD